MRKEKLMTPRDSLKCCDFNLLHIEIVDMQSRKPWSLQKAIYFNYLGLKFYIIQDTKSRKLLSKYLGFRKFLLKYIFFRLKVINSRQTESTEHEKCPAAGKR